MQAGTLSIAPTNGSDVMWNAIRFFIDTLFHRKRNPPEGSVRMYEAMEGLKSSTNELRRTLNQHPEYIMQRTDPIRERLVPPQFRQE